MKRLMLITLQLMLVLAVSPCVAQWGQLPTEQEEIYERVQIDLQVVAMQAAMETADVAYQDAWSILVPPIFNDAWWDAMETGNNQYGWALDFEAQAMQWHEEVNEVWRDDWGDGGMWSIDRDQGVMFWVRWERLLTIADRYEAAANSYHSAAGYYMEAYLIANGQL